MTKYKYQMKPRFEERMKTLLPEAKDFKRFSEIIHTEPLDFIRCNTLKISPNELLNKLRKKWEVKQPFPEFPEIMLITSDLGPGELGNAIEHILGYYYVQEISSMLPVLALDPKPNEFILDLCSSPGSKTTQMAARMKNQGTIIANDLKINRIKILVSNLERCGVTNTITTRKDAISLCSKLSKTNIRFDKILLDVPCSGEGTIRSSPKTFIMWNEKVIKSLSRQQKKFFAFALKCLKKGGTIVYSTCTHSPEENEEVVSFALENFPLKIERIIGRETSERKPNLRSKFDQTRLAEQVLFRNKFAEQISANRTPATNTGVQFHNKERQQIRLPVKCRQGITEWKNKTYHKDTAQTCRIYPQDNDSEGFFLSKFTLMEEVK